MTISAKIVLDSIAPNGCRLTTLEVTYPRFVHSELMTHRVFSRNAASSRAIPTKKKIERIRQDTAMPVEWGVNQKGMQAAGPLPPEVAGRAKALWVGLGNEACEVAGLMDDMGLHKQVANRIIEPWDHITVVLSSTKFSNHKKLRTEVDKVTGRPLPDPTYFELATKMHEAIEASNPFNVQIGDWHLPYVFHDVGGARMWISRDDSREIAALANGSAEAGISLAKKVSTGRCARVSYLRQGQGDIEENIALHDRLTIGHWAPFEHVATPIPDVGFLSLPVEKEGEHLDPTDLCDFCVRVLGDQAIEMIDGYGESVTVCASCGLGHTTSGNFTGWKQYRKEFPDEAGGD